MFEIFGGLGVSGDAQDGKGTKDGIIREDLSIFEQLI